jgi:hypothetical protein
MDEFQNPYHADLADDLTAPDAPPIPFAGRKTVLGRLYQQLSDPSPTASRALVVTGRRHIGKTALLLAFDNAFGDTYCAARVFLRAAPPEDETDLFLTLAEAATEGMMRRGVALGRLSTLEPPEDDPRDWLAKQFLPLALTALRGRQLVFLIDDADRLLTAVRNSTLPFDTFPFLRDALQSFPEIGMVLTLDSDFEGDLLGFAPLVGLNDTQRLTMLESEESRWLLQEPAQGCYTLPDDAAAIVQKATGGTPALVQQFGYQLFRRWQVTPEINVMTLDDVKALMPAVYQYGEADFRYDWLRLPPNEKRVLTAVSQLHYDDPLRKIDAPTIERWLVESDHPLDRTAISAALRGLEYSEMVQATPDGVSVRAGMMQTWLLENARRTTATLRQGSDSRSSDGTREGSSRSSGRGVKIQTVLMLAAVAAILGVLAGFVVFGSPLPGDTLAPAPTVTLVGAE